MSTFVNPAYSDPKDCISTWKEELAVAKGSLISATADFNAATRRYVGAKEWLDQLEVYWTNIRKTDSLARAVLGQLTPFLEHSETLSRNTEYTVEAARILLCELEAVLEKADAMKELLKDLIDLIRGLEPQKLATKPMKILPSLEALMSKFNEAYDLLISCILLAVEVLKGSEQLHTSLEKDAGLIKNLVELKKQLDTPDPPAYCHKAPNENSCQDELNPKPVFPLESNHNRYYLKTQEQVERARGEIAALESEKSGAENRKKAYQACVDSLTNAINTAETAKACS